MLGKAGVPWRLPSGVQIDGLEAQRPQYTYSHYNYFNDYYLNKLSIPQFENILPFLTKFTQGLLGSNSLESLVVLVLWLVTTPYLKRVGA